MEMVFFNRPSASKAHEMRAFELRITLLQPFSPLSLFNGNFTLFSHVFLDNARVLLWTTHNCSWSNLYIHHIL